MPPTISAPLLQNGVSTCVFCFFPEGVDFSPDWSLFLSGMLFTGVLPGLGIMDKSSSAHRDTMVEGEEWGWGLEWEKGTGDGGEEELILGGIEGFFYSSYNLKQNHTLTVFFIYPHIAFFIHLSISCYAGGKPLASLHKSIRIHGEHRSPINLHRNSLQIPNSWQSRSWKKQCIYNVS